MFDQAKSKGAKGDAFDQLEDKLVHQFHEFKFSRTISRTGSKFGKPYILKVSIKEALTQALQLLQSFLTHVNLYNITGAANKALASLKRQ